jgi:hypothetical protein
MSVRLQLLKRCSSMFLKLRALCSFYNCQITYPEPFCLPVGIRPGVVPGAVQSVVITSRTRRVHAELIFFFLAESVRAEFLTKSDYTTSGNNNSTNLHVRTCTCLENHDEHVITSIVQRQKKIAISMENARRLRRAKK